mmetsp:Transcript_27374/g.59766  ORF Transcript_27374/g.59766 Transcript_27374/m.59766 type:complete len:840 (-) Transcript_27374:162-2681(-)
MAHDEVDFGIETEEAADGADGHGTKNGGAGSDGELGASGGRAVPTSIEELLQRYPVDDRARGFLEASPPGVVEHVLREFKPQREGESDYSGLLTSYVKRVRGQEEGRAGMHGEAALASAFDDFQRRYPVDEGAVDYFLSVPAEVQARVLSDFRPQREGESDYSALFMSFVKRCRGGSSSGQTAGAAHPVLAPISGLPSTAIRPPVWSFTQRPTQPQRAEANQTLEAFMVRYPIDERAADYFACQAPEVQMRVLRDFRPKEEGEADYSSLFMSFVKRCRNMQDDDGWGHGGAGNGRKEAAQPQSRGLLGDFIHRYPMDDRAYDYLTSASVEVQEHVARTFVPPRADDVDFSAPIMAYVRQCRRSFGASDPAAIAPSRHGVSHRSESTSSGKTEMALAQFMTSYPLDDHAVEYLVNSPPSVIEQVLREFRPRQEGEADYSALVMSYTKKCRAQAPHAPHVQQVVREPSRHSAFPAHVEQALNRFLKQYRFDDRAMDYLTTSPPGVVEQVVREFQPRHQGEDDSSALLMGFIRRCRSQPQPASAPTRPALSAAAGGGGGAGAAGGSRQLDRAVGRFMARYPIDANAIDYLMSSSPAVVDQVVREFQPRQEGEADYSALVMSFTRRCRGQEDGRKPSGSSGAQAGGYSQGHHSERSGLPIQIEAALRRFMVRYPLDARAVEYLSSAPHHIIDQVTREFRPRNEGETDYSALVTSFTKRCRALEGQPLDGRRMGDGPGPAHHSGNMAGGRSAGSGAGRGGGSHGASQDAVQNFLARYPVDERAVDYLTSSPARVVEQVLREFKPKHEGESDYSALVMGFTKRCRAQDSGSGEGADPPWKRQRVG